jgi:4-carboxymuconolactone decarboxylase
MSLPTNTDVKASPGNPVPLSQNNMDTPEHKTLYEAGLAMRMQVVGEDYVANTLEKGSSDFLRPLQQLATVQYSLSLLFSFSIFYMIT